MKALTDNLTSRVDAFLRDSFSLDAPNGEAEAEIAICEAIEVVLRRRRNKRVLSSRLPTDIIHCVFGLALDLHRVHEPNLPVEVLEGYRKQLFQMRCVCVAWNEFLVSGPRYWLAINLRTPPDILQNTLRCSQQAPLCIYSTSNERRRPKALCEELQIALAGSVGQIRTIRSEDDEFLPLWKELLKGSMSTLEHLQLTTYTNYSNMLDEPIAEWLSDDLPMVREVTASGWQPRADAAWLGNLQILTFCRPMMIDANLAQVLARCSSLSRLRIEADGSNWEDGEPTGAPTTIALPNLQHLELEFDELLHIRHLVRLLEIPESATSSLRIVFAPHSEEFVEDLAHFIFPEGTTSKPPKSPLLELHTVGSPQPATYTVGNRSIKLAVPDRTEEWDLFENIIIVLQNRVHNPPLTVQLTYPADREALTLRRLGNLNVQQIRVKSPNSFLNNVLAAIGSRHENLPSGTVEEAHNWPFESLKELLVEETDVSLSQIARLVGIRRKYLRTSSKEWLKRITLVECNLRGLSLRKTTDQLAAIGVTIVANKCHHRFSD